MKNVPFHSDQFTATKFDSAETKARWTNAMTSWIERGFPENGWVPRLYDPLHRHLFGHIAHYDRHGFYAEWFDGIWRQLAWLEYVARGGLYGGGAGNPAHTWSDVEQALSTWVCESGLLARYRQLCAAEIEKAERAQLAALLAKYNGRICGCEAPDATKCLANAPITNGMNALVETREM